MKPDNKETGYFFKGKLHEKKTQLSKYHQQ